MNKSRLYKVNKFIGQVGQTMAGLKTPDIRWNEIVRIEAFGTDVVSAFAVMITFHYSDGGQNTIQPEHKGYYETIESLDEHFPSIPADWLEEMQAAHKEWPCDVERVLYSRET
jgi:hypothetical protein